MRLYPSSAIAPLLNEVTAAEIATAAGVSERTAVRWRNQNAQLTEAQADAVATLVHVHPAEVWPDWHLTKARPCETCATVFVPYSSGPPQRFCTPQCRWRARDKARRAQTERERYWRDEEYRERKKANAARYTAEVGRIKRRRNAA